MWLRNPTTGTFIGPILQDSPFYMWLRKQKDVNNRPAWEDQGDQEVQGQLVSQFAAIADVSEVQAVGAVTPALGAAATGLFELANASRAGTMVRAVYIPVGAVNGQATNSRTLNVLNGGATGAGVVNMTALALTAGNNLIANQENVLGVTGNVNVNPGDSIQFQSLSVGTGIADPGGIVVVTLALAG